MKKDLFQLLFCFFVVLPIDKVNGMEFIGSFNNSTLIQLPLLGMQFFSYLFFIILAVLLIIYIVIEYKIQMSSREKLKIAMNILNTMQTPIVLLRNELDKLKSEESNSLEDQSIVDALYYTNYILNCSQNIVTLDKLSGKVKPEISNANFELSVYINSIIKQCQPFANARNVSLTVNECHDFVSCRINENIMGAGLQYLFTRMILIADPGDEIGIDISFTDDYWKLKIRNCNKSKNIAKKIWSFIPTFLSIYNYRDLWTVRKIIKLQGGRFLGFGIGKHVTFEITMSTLCHCKSNSCTAVDQFVTKRRMQSINPHSTSKIVLNDPSDDSMENVLLVSSDKLYAKYLAENLSRYFHVSIIDDTNTLVETFIQKDPDAIIMDEFVNGISGNELCARAKANKVSANIPLILLVKNQDNDSYLSHVDSGADRLEMRIVSICKLKADIRMLITNRMVWQERIQLVIDNTIPKTSDSAEPEDSDSQFLNKLREILEVNSSGNGYTVDALSSDMGMSRSALYSKIKEVTGKAPVDYMHSFKMEMALKLLISRQYKITEIADILGFCDAKYFGRKFKDYYDISPTQYLKNIAG